MFQWFLNIYTETCGNYLLNNLYGKSLCILYFVWFFGGNVFGDIWDQQSLLPVIVVLTGTSFFNDSDLQQVKHYHFKIFEKPYEIFYKLDYNMHYRVERWGGGLDRYI